MLYDKPDNEVIITAKYSGYKNVFEILKGRVAGVIVTGDGPIESGFVDRIHIPLKITRLY